MDRSLSTVEASIATTNTQAQNMESSLGGKLDLLLSNLGVVALDQPAGEEIGCPAVTTWGRAGPLAWVILFSGNGKRPDSSLTLVVCLVVRWALGGFSCLRCLLCVLTPYGSEGPQRRMRQRGAFRVLGRRATSVTVGMRNPSSLARNAWAMLSVWSLFTEAETSIVEVADRRTFAREAGYELTLGPLMPRLTAADGRPYTKAGSTAAAAINGWPVKRDEVDDGAVATELAESSRLMHSEAPIGSGGNHLHTGVGYCISAAENVGERKHPSEEFIERVFGTSKRGRVMLRLSFILTFIWTLELGYRFGSMLMPVSGSMSLCRLLRIEMWLLWLPTLLLIGHTHRVRQRAKLH